MIHNFFLGYLDPFTTDCLAAKVPEAPVEGGGWLCFKVAIGMNELSDYDGAVVITNSHTIRKPGSGDGSNFSAVQPRDIRVISFYNGTERGLQITHEVVRIGKVSPPDKNKDKDTLLRRTKEALYGDGTAVTETIKEVISLLDQLAPALTMPEGYLDYAFLFLKPLENDEEELKFG